MGDYFQEAARQDVAPPAYRDVLAAVLKIVTDSRAEMMLFQIGRFGSMSTRAGVNSYSMCDPKNSRLVEIGLEFGLKANLAGKA